MITFKFLLFTILTIMVIEFIYKYFVHRAEEQEAHYKRLLAPLSIWLNKDKQVAQVINIFDNKFGIYYVRYNIQESGGYWSEPQIMKIDIFLKEFNKVTPAH